MASGTAKRTDPKLWEKVKARVTKGGKGGDPGEWSARKAQLAVAEYKKAGGGYEGKKDPAHNHLSQWTKEEWGTKSGQESGETGERYLPKKARETLSDEEYARTTAKKRRDSAAGQQFSAQPEDVARKAAGARKTGKAAAPKRAAATKAGAARKAPARKPVTKPAAPPRKAPVRKPAVRKPAAKPAAGKPAAKPAPKRAAASRAPAAAKRTPARKAAPRKSSKERTS